MEFSDLMKSEWNTCWIKAIQSMVSQTKMAQRIMTTDLNNKSRIYVQGLGLAFQEDSFIYPGDASVIRDFQLENPDGIKVVNDVQNLLNLILTGVFIIS